MSAWYDTPVDEFSAEAEKIRRRLAAVDVAAIRDVPGRVAAGEAKAFAYVWLAAALERSLKDTLTRFLEELNARAVAVNKLQPGLLGLLFDPQLESIRNLRDHEKLWAGRCGMFSNAQDVTIARFDTSVLPLDGRTIRPAHLKVLWQVFHFPGSPFPSPRDSVALSDLADGRNDVAHGEVAPDVFGRRKHMADVLSMIQRVEDVFLHIVSVADRYLRAASYCKVP